MKGTKKNHKYQYEDDNDILQEKMKTIMSLHDSVNVSHQIQEVLQLDRQANEKSSVAKPLSELSQNPLSAQDVDNASVFSLQAHNAANPVRTHQNTLL